MTSPRVAFAALVLSAAGALASCSRVDAVAVATEREEMLDRAASRVAECLSGAVLRARAAVAGTAAALARGGDDRTKRLDEIEALRASSGVDGLVWEGPRGDSVWAGDPVDPKELPAPPPWDASFASGDVTVHAGPFRRALLATGAAGTGTARATVILRTRTDGPFDGTVEERWATRFRVRSVRILPPEVLSRPAEVGVRRAAVRASGDPRDVLAVEVVALKDVEIAALLAEGRRRTEGLSGLAGILLALVLAWIGIGRLISSDAGRAAARAALVLAAREGLALLDLAERFRPLAPLAEVTDFGLPGYFGWLANPFELLLTTVAFLAVAVALGRVADRAPLPSSKRTCVPCAAVGASASGLAAWVWLLFVDAGATQSQLDYFAPGTLLPSLLRAVMLSSLLFATAAAWVLVRAGIRLATRALPAARPFAVRVATAVAAAALAWTLAPRDGPAWAPFLLPAVAVLLTRITPDDPVPATASRILLLSVLSTALLVPVLWLGIDRAAKDDVSADASALARREEQIAEALRLDLPALASDPHLLSTLDRIAEGRPGGVPEGLALHAWTRLPLASTGAADLAVAVFDARNDRLSRFGLNTPSFGLLPPAYPDPDAIDDLTVAVGVEPAKGVRGTVARLRVRRPDGKAVGTIVVVAPDPLSVEVSGTAPRIVPRPEGTGRGRRTHLVEWSLVKDGRVVASTDPDLPRSTEPAGLPPKEEVASRWVTLSGPDGPRETYVQPAGSRGVLLARRVRAGFEDVLFAVGRVSIVGVGLGAILSIAVLLVGVRRFRMRLQDKILASYFLVSVAPLVLLGWLNWRDAIARSEEDLKHSQERRVKAARLDLESIAVEPESVFVQANLASWAATREQDLFVYREGSLVQSSLESLRDAEMIGERLPSEAYRATVLEERDTFLRDERIAGRAVRVAYAPLRDAKGKPFATVGVPLLYDAAAAEKRAVRTGNVLLAAYLLALVLVVVVGIYVARGIARPLGLLSEGAARVGAGELDLAVPGGGPDEVGALVASFNRMTAELKEARAKAAEAERERAWRGMARQVAHEIKNPLTPMKLMLQQLEATAKADPAAAREAIGETVRIALQQIDALARIAGNFAAFARFPPRDVRDADVNAVLASVAALHKGAREGKAEVVLALGEGLPPVRWDADELRRVFLNLISNAVEAMDPAKGRVRVDVRSERGKDPRTGRDGVHVTVSDDGIGIPVENRSRLFEPDFSTKTAGTGLGLAIVKRIVADLAGDIRIDSVPGKGTTVHVWLPASEPPPAA